MLGFVSENFPHTGALGLAIMGGAGMLSVSFVLPVIGRFYDQGIAMRLPFGVETARASVEIQAAAGLETLGKVAVLPAILAAIFFALLATRKQAIATAMQADGSDAKPEASPQISSNS
jgi:hypothetical protein